MTRYLLYKKNINFVKNSSEANESPSPSAVHHHEFYCECLYQISNLIFKYFRLINRVENQRCYKFFGYLRCVSRFYFRNLLLTASLLQMFSYKDPASSDRSCYSDGSSFESRLSSKYLSDEYSLSSIQLSNAWIRIRWRRVTVSSGISSGDRHYRPATCSSTLQFSVVLHRSKMECHSLFVGFIMSRSDTTACFTVWDNYNHNSSSNQLKNSLKKQTSGPTIASLILKHKWRFVRSRPI